MKKLDIAALNKIDPLELSSEQRKELIGQMSAALEPEISKIGMAKNGL